MRSASSYCLPNGEGWKAARNQTKCDHHPLQAKRCGSTYQRIVWGAKVTPCFEEVNFWFTPERLANFWAKVEKRSDGCWKWLGALTDTGHGQYRMLGGTVRVHRLTWIMARQRDIESWMKIRHLMCDHKWCINPGHLVGGTQGENNSDRTLIHAAYDWDQEQRARAEYLKHPYIGYFQD